MALMAWWPVSIVQGSCSLESQGEEYQNFRLEVYEFFSRKLNGHEKCGRNFEHILRRVFRSPISSCILM